MKKELNNITINQTPIEIVLGIDAEGKTTARKLYEFLELNPSNYSKWYKTNILENEFAEENIDYWVFVLNDENPQGGRPTQDFKLTASFAKKLSMTQKNEKGEQARNYFIKVEDNFKETVNEKKQPNQVESLTIKEVKFLDDVLRVGQDKQGRIFVGVNDICKALGMNKARKDKEIIAVQKDETLKKGCKKFSSGAFYWFGSAITLQLDYIPLWLTKIKITPSMRVNNPNAANKLVEYQSQAKDVLAAAFFANNTLITYPPALSHYTASAVAELGRITKSIMEKQGSSPRKIAEIFKLECQQFGIYLPEDFVEMPIYEQLSLDINEIITR